MADRHGSPWRKGEFPAPGKTSTDPAPADSRVHPVPRVRQRAGNPVFGVPALTRSTEAAGWQALWCADRRGIRILQVRNLSDGCVPVHCIGCGAAPDLADMREQLPELSRLWDSIRREFWAHILLEGRTG